MGFESKHSFTPPTLFLGLLLRPWTWGLLTAAPVPALLLGLTVHSLVLLSDFTLLYS